MLQGEDRQPAEFPGVGTDALFRFSVSFSVTNSTETATQSIRCLCESMKLLLYVCHVLHKPRNLVHITLQCRQCLPKFVEFSLTSRDQETVHGCFLGEL